MEQGVSRLLMTILAASHIGQLSQTLHSVAYLSKGSVPKAFLLGIGAMVALHIRRQHPVLAGRATFSRFWTSLNTCYDFGNYASFQQVIHCRTQALCHYFNFNC